MTDTISYSKKVFDYFQKPKNYGRILKPDGVGQVGNFRCGDIMMLYIKVSQNKKKQEIIKDIKFETLGCVAAIATSSAITGMVKGKSIDEALKINKDKIIKLLGGLPQSKIHCSILAVDALSEAVYNYLQRSKKQISPALEEKHQRIKKLNH
jgi:nitrogen fixation NifU-like protein